MVALAGGLGFAFADGGLGAMGSHLLHALIALVVGIGLFAARIVGGGDAKFYAGIAAWFTLADGARLLLAVSLGGLVLFLVWFVYRRLSRKPISRRDGVAEGKFPYGVAIAAGAVIASGSALI
jgi:prepilin peptidase CpaA